MNLPPALESLVEELAKLPSIGKKTAKRLAFHLVTEARARPGDLARALEVASVEIGQCETCGGLSQGPICNICADRSRQRNCILVVEDAKNVFTVESSGIYKGLYHVLGGAISPLRGLGPDGLRISQLERRVAEGEVQELILATNPTLEGEATAHYLMNLFSAQSLKISRIARGMPSGGDLEYADSNTLARAIEGRTNFT
ncbi:MAG: recombination mediator RecR [SAR324 cluster bacterium]|nr:recombination mediator RecR [SAR324 cluster bacterium]